MLHPKVRELGIETGPRLFARWTDGQLDAVALLSKPTAAVSDAAPDQPVIGGRQPFPAALRCAVASVSKAPEFRSERRAGGWLATGIGVGWFFFWDSYVLSVLLGSGSEHATLREKIPPSGDIDRSIVHACRHPLNTSSEKLLPWSWEEEQKWSRGRSGFSRVTYICGGWESLQRRAVEPHLQKHLTTLLQDLARPAAPQNGKV